MALTTKMRLEMSVKALEAIETQRAKTGNPTLFTAVEHEVIARELNELEAEWARESDADWAPVLADLEAEWVANPAPGQVTVKLNATWQGMTNGGR